MFVLGQQSLEGTADFAGVCGGDHLTLAGTVSCRNETFIISTLLDCQLHFLLLSHKPKPSRKKSQGLAEIICIKIRPHTFFA